MSSKNELAAIYEIVDRALKEDLGDQGDITSRAVFTKSEDGCAEIRSKESGTLSGVYIIEPLFHRIDPTLSVDIQVKEGATVSRGTIIAVIKGGLYGILCGERIALNFLQRLSGIATFTARLVHLVQGTRARILDTRKTTPGLRIFEKMAVVAGGGMNHRFGLFDMVLLKDTHVKSVGSPAEAIRRARAYTTQKIEVEVQSIAEFKNALTEKPNRIMLDNMSLSDMAFCVSYIRRGAINVELEASGNLTAETVRPVAETGVDFISVGAITHSVKALDIHLILV